MFFHTWKRNLLKIEKNVLRDKLFFLYMYIIKEYYLEEKLL